MAAIDCRIRGGRIIAVVGARLFFLGAASRRRIGTRRHLPSDQRILLALTLVADVTIFLRGRFRLAAHNVGILGPCRIVGGDCAAGLGRRQLRLGGSTSGPRS